MNFSENVAVEQTPENKALYTYTNIYCIELEDGYYYIGRSHNIRDRYTDHVEGDGSLWTSLHKPIKIVETLLNVNTFEEDRMVKQYMSIYGIDKVRGGTYITEKLSEDEVYFIQKEIWSAQGACMKCGRTNHLSKGCRYGTDINGTVLFDPNVICEECSRLGHTKGQCKARTRQDGSMI